MAYYTVQARHSERWLKRITDVKAFTLENGFSGKPCPVSALRFAIERLNDRLQLNEARTAGKLRCHSNCWYEFTVSETDVPAEDASHG